MESRHSTKSLEGMGSSSHDLGVELRMHSFTVNCDPTLAIVKSFHLAIMSTEKIELMGMEVRFWASQPTLTAIKLKLKQKAN